MHFFYIDEAGCTGDDLANPEQPVFVAGGVIIRDEGWNKTKEVFDRIINDYFNNQIPENFELHSSDLFSPDGGEFFNGHSRERRNALANSLLDLLDERSHNTFYVVIDKDNLLNADASHICTKNYLNCKIPYLLAYDYLISNCEWFTKKKLGRSARGLIIIDVKDQYESQIALITNHRRYKCPTAQRVKWLVEFTYSVDSKKNPMVQLSDLVCFIVKKYMEIDLGYKDAYPAPVKILFRDMYSKVHDRSIKKEIQDETGRNSKYYNDFLKEVIKFPKRTFKRTVF